MAARIACCGFRRRIKVTTCPTVLRKQIKLLQELRRLGTKRFERWQVTARYERFAHAVAVTIASCLAVFRFPKK
jgi:hypothetical protein